MLRRIFENRLPTIATPWYIDFASSEKNTGRGPRKGWAGALVGAIDVTIEPFRWENAARTTSTGLAHAVHRHCRRNCGRGRVRRAGRAEQGQGQGPAGTRQFELTHCSTQITKANVGQLEMAWFYPYAAPTFSPVFANDVLYGLGRNASALVALDPATGKEIWVHEGLNGITSKGINYWESADGKDRRLIFAVDSFLQEIDARTGKTIPTFGENGIVDMRVGLPRAEGTSIRAMPASPGRIWRNIMIFGGQSGESIMTPPGDIRAYDVLTGKLLWQFHTIPRPGRVRLRDQPARRLQVHGRREQLGRDVDRRGARNRLHPDGVSHGRLLRRRSRTARTCSRTACSRSTCETGKRLWHFQTVHHDLWDLDNVSAPQLVTVTHDGRKVDVVAHAGKTGFLYVFERVTGRAAVADRGASGGQERGAVRAVVAHAAVPDEARRRSRGSRSRKTT